jgi:hypothetical protein
VDWWTHLRLTASAAITLNQILCTCPYFILQLRIKSHEHLVLTSNLFAFISWSANCIPLSYVTAVRLPNFQLDWSTPSVARSQQNKTHSHTAGEESAKAPLQNNVTLRFRNGLAIFWQVTPCSLVDRRFEEAFSLNLKIYTARFSEYLVRICQTTRRPIPEENIHHCYHRNDLKYARLAVSTAILLKILVLWEVRLSRWASVYRRLNVGS